ncbi:energy transducer TonB [Kordia sp.]|uniref:energy transducer TonB n=1 Tax=Kordia sp. TaxID=1965332 RepID=UPI003B5B6B2B
MSLKKFLCGLACCFAIVANAQTDTTKKAITAESTVIQGCQFEEEVYECSREELRLAIFQFLKPEDAALVAQKTKQDIIFVKLGLATDETGKIVKERSSLKFYETEMKPIDVELKTQLEDFKIELAPISQKQNSYITNHLFLKIDRENNVFIPLYDHKPKRIPFSGPEVTPIYRGCESTKTNKERKRCMSDKVSEFVGKNYKTRLARKAKLNGTVKVFVVFKINEQGKAVNIRSRAPHPILEKEAIRVIRRLPRMKPATIENIPVSVNFTLPIVFKVQ